MSFTIKGLNPEDFAPLFAMSADDLKQRSIVELEASDSHFPCRISLEEAQVGDRLLLLNHVHQPANTPYRSSHAVFVSESAKRSGLFVSDIPPIMRTRLLSVRAFDGDDMITDADVVDGREAGTLFARFLDNPKVAYLHVHFAKRGCFAGRVDKA